MTGPTHLVPNRTRRPIRLSLAELLEAYAEAIRAAPGDVNWEAIEAERDRLRAEILWRFDR